VSLLELCLADQADLSAVERFTRRHDSGVLPETGRWRDLVPLSHPAPGQQYGFEVDLDACTGCKACVTACRSLNGLDEDESWRTVGLLHGTSLPVQQTVTAACHHCLEPACLAGCPVDAYEKDPVTGIVHHLDDQCIGCGYCTFTCPYDVPRFNQARGIVRKCDMCAGRLAVGEAPACVQACPNDAIRVALVDVTEIRERTREDTLVPGAPPSALTVPTTVYRSQRGLAPGLVPADRFALGPARAHPPLAVMLVLTQLSVGAFLADWCLRTLAPDGVAAGHRPTNALVALALGLLALGASVLHLGRPRYAWRAVIGLRHSWLSREILAFSVFAALACSYAGLLWLGPASGSPLADALGAVVAAAGAAGVVCSVMIYAVTRRPFWGTGRTAVRFALTTAGCGLATVLVTTLTAARVPGDVAMPLALTLAGVMAAKLIWEAAFLRHARHAGHSDLGRSARLLTTDLARLSRWRFGLGLGGGVGFPLLVALGASQTNPPAELCAAGALLAAVALVAGELCERTQFFAAVTSPGMTGNLP
jgi:formate dehydrogenase iron-sulfur subunit